MYHTQNHIFRYSAKKEIIPCTDPGILGDGVVFHTNAGQRVEGVSFHRGGRVTQPETGGETVSFLTNREAAVIFRLNSEARVPIRQKASLLRISLILKSTEFSKSL